ncbi:MAG TPA: glycoside hydrolase domain-containing protein [Chthoniobacteraceae bacterium]|nr:glycoside hydrolase domain-containing protein [Chthoniobacteraceae bacterium]
MLHFFKFALPLLAAQSLFTGGMIASPDADFTGDVPADVGIATQANTWGGVTSLWTREYRYGNAPSLKLTFPERQGGVWFTPQETDWSAYGELVFTLYNPWNETRTRTLALRESGGDKANRLPENISIPGGRLTVPRETRVTFRLDLTSPELLRTIDIGAITGIHIGAGSPETTFYLDGFQLRTHEEVASEKKEALSKTVASVRARLLKQQATSPKAYRKPIQAALASMEELLEPQTPPAETIWRPLINRAGELATVLEALALQGKSARALEIYPVSSMEKVFRDQPPAADRSALQLEAAGHERVSFQAVVVPRQPLRGVRITPSPLALADDPSVEIAASEIDVRTVAYVEVTDSFYFESSRVGWWPDPLPPAGPVDVTGRIQPFWITIHVPPGQKAGLYHGQLRVTAEDGVESTLAYQLHVWDFSLPVQGELQTLISFTYTAKEEAIRRACYATLLDHRISPVNIYVNGSVQFGYQPERSDLKFCLDRGMNTLVLWNPYNNQADFPYDFDDAYIKKMVGFLRDYEPELKKEGAWKISMVLGFDEITHKGKEFADRASKGAGHLLGVLRKEFPGLRMANIGGPPIPSTLTGPGNIWIPQTSIVEPRWKASFEAMRQQKGSEYFFYWVYGDPSFMLDLPGIAPRWLSWIAFKYGARGIGYYSSIRNARFDDAPEGVDWSRKSYNIEATNRIGRNGDGVLVYPARDGSIIPSIRLANTRDGIEDYEYLAILRKLVEQTGDRDAARLLTFPDTFLTHQIYSRDPQDLLSFRREVAQAIERLQKGRPPQP